MILTKTWMTKQHSEVLGTKDKSNNHRSVELFRSFEMCHAHSTSMKNDKVSEPIELLFCSNMSSLKSFSCTVKMLSKISLKLNHYKKIFVRLSRLIQWCIALSTQDRHALRNELFKPQFYWSTRPVLVIFVAIDYESKDTRVMNHPKQHFDQLLKLSSRSFQAWEITRK